MKNKAHKKYTYKKHVRGDLEFYELISDFTLSNFASIQYNVGSANDPKGKEGMVHIIEHLFTHATGTEYLEREYRDIQKYAYTYKERTVYSARSTIASVLTLCDELVMGLLNRKDSTVLEKEVKTITSEILSDKQNHSSEIYNEALKRCSPFIKDIDGYIHDIKGSEKSIKNINITDIDNFIESKYINPKIVITSKNKLGKLDIANIFELISKLKWSKQKLIKPLKLTEHKIKISKFNFKSRDSLIYTLCIERPQTFTHDVFLGFLHEYLAGNWSSVLTQKLRIDKQLVYFTKSSYYSYKKFAMIYISFETSKENLAESKKICDDTINSVLAGSIDEKVCVATRNMRIRNLTDIYRYEHDQVYDFLDMLNLEDNSINTGKINCLNTYIDETLNINSLKLSKYLKMSQHNIKRAVELKN